MSSDRAGASQLSWWVIVPHHRKGGQILHRETLAPYSGGSCLPQGNSGIRLLLCTRVRNIDLCPGKGEWSLSELGP